MNSRPAASGRKRAGEGERGRICRPLDTDEETPTPIDSDDLGILPCPPAIAYRSTRGLPSFSLPLFILSWRLAPAMFLFVVFRPTFNPLPPCYPCLEFRSLPFLAPSFSFSVRPIGPFLRFALFLSRIVYWIYLLLTGYTRKQVCHHSPFPSVFPSSSLYVSLPSGFSIFDFLRFLLSSFAFFRCCRFLEFQRYELGRDGSEGRGLTGIISLKVIGAQGRSNFWYSGFYDVLVET